MNIRLPKSLFIVIAGAVGGVAAWVAGEAVLLAADGGESQEDLPPVLYGADASTALDLTVLTNAFPKFEPELQSRLDRENARSGDLQVSLMWYGQNDLDLHCVDPSGERIWHEHRKAASGGELDVDMNARHPVLQRIALVLDTSGSMSGERLREVKAAAVDFIRKIDIRSIEVAVISFNSQAKLVTPFTRNRLRLEYAIQTLMAGGSTQMQLGIGAALNEMGFGFDSLWQGHVSDAKNGNVTVGRLSRDRKRVKLPEEIRLTELAREEREFASKDTIVLFTDGDPSDGSGPITVLFAQAARRKKIAFLSIGASGAKVEFLKTLAARAEDVFFAKDGQLGEAFSQVASRFKSPFVQENIEKRLREPKIFGLAVVPYAPVMSANFKLEFNLAAMKLCERLVGDGHRVTVASRLGSGYFATEVTTNLSLLRSAVESITWEFVREPAEVVKPIVARLVVAAADSTNEVGGLIVAGTVERSSSSTIYHTTGASRPIRTVAAERIMRPLTTADVPLMFATVAKPRRSNTNTWVTVNTHAKLPDEFVTSTNQSRVGSWLRVRNPRYNFKNYQEVFEWFEVMSRYRFGQLDALDLTRTKTDISGKPVENIFWPTNDAPDGEFEISVVHYGAYERETRTPFSVHVRTALKQQTFRGEINPRETNTVFRGYLGPASDREVFARERAKTVAERRREHFAELQRQLDEWNANSQAKSGMRVGVMAIWSGCVALWLCLTLHLAQQWMVSHALGRWRHLWRSVAIVVVVAVIGSMLVHFVASVLPRWSLDVSFLLPELDRLAPVLGWPFLGVVLGLGIGLSIPNLRWWRAGVAGLATGAIAGIGFEFVSRLGTDAAARFCGLLLMGAGIGMAIKLMEVLAREAALVVHWHANERSVVNLGVDPVMVGSGPEANLYVPPERHVPELACLIYFADGRIWIEEARRQRTLLPGERFVIGDVGFEIETDVR